MDNACCRCAPCRFRPRLGLPVESARIVGEDPRAAGIDPLADDAQPGDELLAAQREIPHNLLDFAAQHASIVLGLQPQDAPERTLEHLRRQLEIKPLDIRGRETHRQRAGNDGPGGRPADEIEPVAEMSRLLQVFRQNRFDLLEERNRDRAAHAAAVEREHALGSRTEEVPVTVAGAVTPRGPAIHHNAGLREGFRVGRRGHQPPSLSLPTIFTRSRALEISRVGIILVEFEEALKR